MNTEYPLTLVVFKSWLESKNKEDIVGVTRDALSCPIATALLQCIYVEEGNQVRVGYPTTAVNPYFISETLRFENPDWVREFVSEADLTGENTKVTAKDALKIINNLYICTVCNQYNPEGTNCGKKDNCPW